MLRTVLEQTDIGQFQEYLAILAQRLQSSKETQNFAK
jgi:hypothetical protein